MAVYTALDRDVADRLLARFGVGPARALRPIAEGIENTNYRVDTAAGRFVLTVYERAPAPRVAAVLETVAALRDRGVPVPRSAPAADGAALVTWRGKAVSLVTFCPGDSDPAPGPARLEALGRCLARLHRAGADLRLPADAHRPERLLPAAEELARSLEGGHPHLAGLLAAEARWQAARLPDPDLPGGLIHADLFRDNVLFVPGEPAVAALLDFHLGGTGPWLFDLAVVLLDWCWTGAGGAAGLDGDRARALLRGYRAVRPPGGAEYAHLPVLLRRAALRYLCLRCERFLVADGAPGAGVRKDPQEFAAVLEALRGGEAG